MIINLVKQSEFTDAILLKIVELASFAIKERNIFHIVLSGGETPLPVYTKLKNIDTIWSKWQFWIADERIPSASFTDLNKNSIKSILVQNIGIKESQIHFIQVELGMSKAIEYYKNELNNVNQFDLCLLGIGEDGHTASLFPGNDLGIGKDSPDVLAVLNSPKPPCYRITLSANRLSNSTDVLFLARGKNKKNIINQILCGRNLPANLIRGKNQTFIFYSEE
jgi:6-phosphogluconolactonase